MNGRNSERDLERDERDRKFRLFPRIYHEYVTLNSRYNENPLSDNVIKVSERLSETVSRDLKVIRSSQVKSDRSKILRFVENLTKKIVLEILNEGFRVEN